MEETTSLVLLSQQTLVVGDELRPYQVIEVRNTAGNVTTVFSRYLNDDGTMWVRHGGWREFHPNGRVASEGTYRHGLEDGHWCDYHKNGQLAAEGIYRAGKEAGIWHFWSDDGTEEQPRDFGAVAT